MFADFSEVRCGYDLSDVVGCGVGDLDGVSVEEVVVSVGLGKVLV